MASLCVSCFPVSSTTKAGIYQPIRKLMSTNPASGARDAALRVGARAFVRVLPSTTRSNGGGPPTDLSCRGEYGTAAVASANVVAWSDCGRLIFGSDAAAPDEVDDAGIATLDLSAYESGFNDRINVQQRILQARPRPLASC